MYNFDSYNVLLSIATNIPVTYDCFCAAGSYFCIEEIVISRDLFVRLYSWPLNVYRV